MYRIIFEYQINNIYIIIGTEIHIILIYIGK